MKMEIMKEKLQLAGAKLKLEFYRMMSEERGDIGIKQIAITVGVIVIVGLAVSGIGGMLPTMVQEVFDFFMEKLETITG